MIFWDLISPIIIAVQEHVDIVFNQTDRRKQAGVNALFKWYPVSYFRHFFLRGPLNQVRLPVFSESRVVLGR